jgi:hypothetical protein
MGIFSSWKRKQALKQYARELPRRLSQDYGASTFFTRGQVATAITKLKLNPNFSVYAYAMFLSEDEYNAGHQGTPASLSYLDARVEFARYLPPPPAGSSSFYESGIGMTGGGGTY